MKLIRAEFENFRLLRHLNLEFSTDSTKKLTVIRAENETGKTTILNGLQWALYDDDGLPGKGRDYRLHPIDWDADGWRVPISVQVDFEITKLRQSQRGLIPTKEQYRIIRSAYETTMTGARDSSTASLFRLTDRGSELIKSPEARIREVLPLELREVFFTDGDRALSFIDASVTDKREHVEKAIRALLGLDVIEDALKHVKKTASEFNKEAKAIGADETLTQVTARLEQIEESPRILRKK